jgi:hypothetical protein
MLQSYSVKCFTNSDAHGIFWGRDLSQILATFQNDADEISVGAHAHTIVNTCLELACWLNTQNANCTNNSLHAPARAAVLVSLLVASLQVVLASCGFCYPGQEAYFVNILTVVYNCI